MSKKAKSSFADQLLRSDLLRSRRSLKQMMVTDAWWKGERTAFLELLRRMLALDAEKSEGAKRLLRHQWVDGLCSEEHQ